MDTRSALLPGAIRPGCEEAFYGLATDGLMPVRQALPNALAVRVLRPERAEADVPLPILVQQIDCPSIEAVNEAETSPVHACGAPSMERLRQLFDGTLTQIVHRRPA